MPASIAVQRAWMIVWPLASTFNTHSPLLSMVVATSYSHVRMLRPATALFTTVTRLSNSASNWPPQPIGHGPPVATVESPAIQTVMLAGGADGLGLGVGPADV